MSARPVAAMNDAVARQIVREHNADAGSIAVALADEVLARGGWKANTCKPLLRAYEIAASQAGHSERMSDIETPWGVLRSVTQDGEKVWKIRCPQCGHWGQIDDDQLHGRVSLDHTNCGASYAQSECDCTWHETHDYSELPDVAFALRLQQRVNEDKPILDRLAGPQSNADGAA